MSHAIVTIAERAYIRARSSAAPLSRPLFQLTAIASLCVGLSMPLQAEAKVNPTTSLPIQITSNASQTADTLVLLLDNQLRCVNDSCQDAGLKKAIENEGFKGDYGQTLLLQYPIGTYARVLLLGTGDLTALSSAKAAELASKIYPLLQSTKAKVINLDGRLLEQQLEANKAARLAADMAQGLQLRSYRFDQYRTKDAKPLDWQLNVITNNQSGLQQTWQQQQAVAAGVFLARDLVNQPAADLTPSTFADAALALRDLGVKVQVLDVAQMEKLGMGAILAVGRGSDKPPRMVIAHWQGSKAAPLAIIGKGITFDTGGYNLKTDAESLVRMTSDMAGAAAALGTIKALAQQKAPVNVVAVMAMAENKISSNAFLPGDVIRSAAGLTIQITNTDAEGRLVLADAMWYANSQFKPQAMVDIATLTGAKVGALGNYYAGLFSPNESLVSQLTAAGQQVNEPLWRLPVDDRFAGEMKSEIADLRNSGKTAGASSAAWFLQQFAGNTPWAHLDIAGNAHSSSDKGVTPQGGTGFGVQLLTQWALSYQPVTNATGERN